MAKNKKTKNVLWLVVLSMGSGGTWAQVDGGGLSPKSGGAKFDIARGPLPERKVKPNEVDSSLMNSNDQSLPRGSVSQAAPERAGHEAYQELQRQDFDHLNAAHNGSLTADEFMSKKRLAWSQYASGQGMSIDACVKASIGQSMARLKMVPQKSGIPDSVQPMNENQAMKDFGPLFRTECVRMDVQNRGFLSWEDYASQTWRQFKTLDVNHDGVLSFNEYSAHIIHTPKKPPPVLSPEIQSKINQDLLTANPSVPMRVGVHPTTSSPLPNRQPAPLSSNAQKEVPALGGATPAKDASLTESISEKLSQWFR